MPSQFHAPLSLALDHALSHLEGLATGPVTPTACSETLRARLRRPLMDDGIAPDQVIADLARDVEGGIMGTAGGRFFAWVIGGAVPASLAADWLAAAWDQNAATDQAGPAAAIVEEVAAGWLKEILGLPASASYAFVTGCQMAHFTCLAAARHALLAKRGWDVERRGLYGAPPLRILTSTERHGTSERALRYLGLGLDHLIDLPTDDAGRLAPGALDKALAEAPDVPTIIILQAADLNIGAYDPFQELIPAARRHGAWVHVDGAFGLWAAASPRFRHLLAGAGQADSWATDGHKWLNVPYDCGYAFVAHHEPHRAAMSYRPPYIAFQETARDQMDWTPEWSRRARGFATYAALRQLGRRGVASLVERCCDHARALTLGIGGLRGAEMLWEPTVNQGLVRFLDPGGRDHDRRTEEVIARINASGEAFFQPTTWRGKRAMRISVCNWQTSEADVGRVIEAAARAIREAASGC
ncbi:MAG TPA: pyridoxal-dependent decarboxylase [Candidatus Sulfopaludibacter sp.]|nr:pyridoxal-dependent decarboxylase [Candidatus Sulfopaludibacter sp.]